MKDNKRKHWQRSYVNYGKPFLWNACDYIKEGYSRFTHLQETGYKDKVLVTDFEIVISNPYFL